MLFSAKKSYLYDEFIFTSAQAHNALLFVATLCINSVLAQTTRTFLGQVFTFDNTGTIANNVNNQGQFRYVNDVVVSLSTLNTTYNVVSTLGSATGNTCTASGFPYDFNNKNGAFRLIYPKDPSSTFQTVTMFRAERTTPWVEGISTLDLVKLSQHRLKLATPTDPNLPASYIITNPFSIVASDIYQDNMLKLGDFGLLPFNTTNPTTAQLIDQYTYDNWIVNRFILGVITDPTTLAQPKPTNTNPIGVSNGTDSWCFIPYENFQNPTSTFSTQFFANPLSINSLGRTNPNNYALPFKETGGSISSYAYTIGTNCSVAGLIAIKKGDVNRSASTVYPLLKSQKVDDVSLFNLKDNAQKSFKKGSVVEIQFKINDFIDILSAQIGFRFDETKLKSLGVSKDGRFSKAVNIGTNQSDIGEIKTSWYDPKGLLGNWNNGTHLFSVKFEVTDDIADIETLFHISQVVMPYEVLDQNESPANVSVELTAEEIKGGTNAVVIAPNPTSSSTEIIFDTDKTEEINIDLFNALGNTVLSKRISTIKGQNRVNIDMSNLSTGIYLCKIGNEIQSKKIIKN